MDVAGIMCSGMVPHSATEVQRLLLMVISPSSYILPHLDREMIEGGGVSNLLKDSKEYFTARIVLFHFKNMTQSVFHSICCEKSQHVTHTRIGFNNLK